MDRRRNGAGFIRSHVIGAQRIGVPVEEYERQRNAGNAWCSFTKHWAPSDTFPSDAFGRRQTKCLGCQTRKANAATTASTI